MASITKMIDVRINIIRPFITKNIADDDLSRITQNNNLKYESLKSTTPQGSIKEELFTDSQSLNALTNSIIEMDSIYDEFEDLAAIAERELNKIVYTYDISLEENEMIANAERILFGSASGVITFAKYKKVLAYEQIVNRQISETMVNSGGTINVA